MLRGIVVVVLCNAISIRYKLRLLMYLDTGRCPPDLKNLLPASSSSGRSGWRSATTAQYVKPRLRTVFGERAFFRWTLVVE